MAQQINRFSAVLFRTYLEDGEEIELIIHKHVFALIKPVVFNAAVFIAIPIFVWTTVPKLALLSAIAIIWGAWKIIYDSISWYFNAILLTNLNLVDITWNGFFDRAAIRIEYNQIESFAYSITGFVNTLINNGDVVVVKNSGIEVPLPSLYSPKKKTQLLTAIQDKFMTNHNQRQSGAIKDLLTSMLEQHILEHGLVIDDQ